MEKEKQEIFISMIKDKIEKIEKDFIQDYDLYKARLTTYEVLDTSYELSLDYYYDIERYIDDSSVLCFIDDYNYIKLLEKLCEHKENIMNKMAEV